MDSQCDKLVTVIGHQFITLTVDICVQHGGHEAVRRAGLSAAAETCLHMFTTADCQLIELSSVELSDDWQTT